MKTELVIRDREAFLVLTCVSDFEKQTVDRLAQAYPLRSVEVNIDKGDYHYTRSDAHILSARIEISFLPEPPQPPTVEQGAADVVKSFMGQSTGQ